MHIQFLRRETISIYGRQFYDNDNNNKKNNKKFLVMCPLEIYSYREMAQQITKNIDNDKKYMTYLSILSLHSVISHMIEFFFFHILQMQQFYDYFYLGVLLIKNIMQI